MLGNCWRCFLEQLKVGDIGAALVATYILGICWRYFLEQLEVREKNPSDCYGLPAAAQISPPPPT
jgi:hypothetical protein